MLEIWDIPKLSYTKIKNTLRPLKDPKKKTMKGIKHQVLSKKSKEGSTVYLKINFDKILEEWACDISSVFF